MPFNSQLLISFFNLLSSRLLIESHNLIVILFFRGCIHDRQIKNIKNYVRIAQYFIILMWAIKCIINIYANRTNFAQLLMKKKLKILAISDTHQQTSILEKIAQQQQGDIFIHAGDFTYYGQTHFFIKFCEILDKLKFKHKVVISGNHQISLDNGTMSNRKKQQYLKQFQCKFDKEQILKMLKMRCYYLEHQSIQIQGIKIFGSPYTQMYCGSAFQYQLKFQQCIWDQIPKGVDILVTHQPPYGILDQNIKKIKAGSYPLLKKVEQIRPRFHIFGHIHESKGNIKKGQTIFMNVAFNPLKILY